MIKGHYNSIQDSKSNKCIYLSTCRNKYFHKFPFIWVTIQFFVNILKIVHSESLFSGISLTNICLSEFKSHLLFNTRAESVLKFCFEIFLSTIWFSSISKCLSNVFDAHFLPKFEVKGVTYTLNNKYCIE